VAAACALCCALTIAMPRWGDAQTWHWTYVTRGPKSPLLAAQATVAIDADALRTSYTIPLAQRPVVIEACRAGLSDVQSANTFRTKDTSYLLIRFKPAHNAACASGGRSAVALPADGDTYVNTVAAAINRSCCAVAGHAAPAPAPAAGATTPSPGPKITLSPGGAKLQDWVENDGLFWFVRIRNTSGLAIASTGEVFNCRDADVGCGPFGPARLEPGGTVTVATIATASSTKTPAFTYRYTAGEGAQQIAGSGTAAKIAPPAAPRLSAQELRAAQAGVIEGFRSTVPAGPGPLAVVRLVRRGSSRLAIGQTGTAVVRLTIAANGAPEEAAILSLTNNALAAAAIETAVSSTYAPAMQNGHPVEAKYVATFSFDGTDPALASVPVWKRAVTPSPSPPPPLPSPSPLSPAAPLGPSAPPAPSLAPSAPPALVPVTSQQPAAAETPAAFATAPAAH
jgi:hypothetical protein